MTSLLDWLAGLPAPLLYLALCVAAFAENVFPPLPADTVIALGAFVAARGSGTPVGVWLATMIGNLGGAMLLYGVGYKYGLPWLMKRFPRLMPAGAAERVSERFATQGLLGVAISRFIPGVRAVVPPVAGALRIGAVRAAIAMTVASGIWYGLVCMLAYRAGSNADAFLARIAGQQRLVAIVAGVLLLVAVGVVLVRRRPRGAPNGDT
jgi:membrane protein DedA with SNARE-associated domain